MQVTAFLHPVVTVSYRQGLGSETSKFCCSSSTIKWRTRNETPKRRRHVSTSIQCTQTLPPVDKIAAKKPTAPPKMTVDGDSLKTTPSQIALVSTHFSLCAFIAARLIMSTPAIELLPHGLAFGIAYFFTDLAVGIYHHAVDNYGSENTPILGYQIAAFQGHHKFPWTITNRSFSNNLYRLTKPTIPQLLALLIFPFPALFTTFYASFLFFLVLSQETHRQAHMSRPALWARSLQKMNLFISQKAHASHHRAAFDCNYGILSGHCNGLLDNTRFFRLLEGIIFMINQNEPECWRLDPKLKIESMQILQMLGLRMEKIQQ